MKHTANEYEALSLLQLDKGIEIWRQVGGGGSADIYIELAQVYATLAVAAATREGVSTPISYSNTYFEKS
jgi:hypothetical protein